MANKLVLSLVGLLVCLGLAIGATVSAQHPQCASCGCREKPKSKICLVKTYQRVAMPNYECISKDTFYPQKGMVWHQRNQNDAFLVQRKNRCGEPCFECDCKTGCQCLAGASRSGCHQSTSVRQPAGTTLQWIPIVKWTKVDACPSCGAYETEIPPMIDGQDVDTSPESVEPIPGETVKTRLIVKEARLPPIIDIKDATGLRVSGQRPAGAEK